VRHFQPETARTGIMSIIDIVKGKARFTQLKDGELWYQTEVGDFEFPVPLADTVGAVFRAEDKAIFFMRWIRKHMSMLEKARADASAA
jgi:hypothetical protein